MKSFRIFENEGRSALVFCLGLSLSALMGGCFSAERKVFNQTVLEVNGHEVSTKDYADRLAIRLKNYDSLFVKDEANLARVKEETIQAFIIELIARDYAAQAGIKVSASEVDALVADVRSKYPDDFSFRRALADENLPLEKWRADMEFSILQKKIFSSVTASATPPTEAELRAYFENNKSQFQVPARVRLRQIVLEKEDDAQRIADSLAKGADFEKLARKFSIAPEANNGGDTGWIEAGTLEIFDQALKMQVGTRSRILKSPYGWHIFEVLKKEPESRLSFENAKDKIRARLMESRHQAVFSKWLEERIRKSSVKRNDDIIRAIKVTTRGT